jgi:hypothetical protein
MEETTVTDKQEIRLEEKSNLIEKEVATLAGQVEELTACLREFEDMRLEIAGLKLFLGREYPGFKSEFPGLVQKVAKKTGFKSSLPAHK